MVVKDYYPPWFSVAPMMNCSNNHYRTLAPSISKHAWLYTEMLAAETIVYHNHNLDRFLAFYPDQHPIVLQLGGNDLENLETATKLAKPYCHDEINFNCGCPSPRVAGLGCFGCRLMLNPKFVGEAMSVISANSGVPVSVKCRIGVDDHDSYNELCDFIYKASSTSPTKNFIIHSRKALLNGISPADNRKIPPLKYEFYYALLHDFPDLEFTINGGINSVDVVNAALSTGAHGVMVGRATYQKRVLHKGRSTSSNLIIGLCPWGETNAVYRYINACKKVWDRSYFLAYLMLQPLLRLFTRSLEMVCGNEKSMLLSAIARYGSPWNKLQLGSVFSTRYFLLTITSLLEKTLVAIPDCILDSSSLTEAPSGCCELARNTASSLCSGRGDTHTMCLICICLRLGNYLGYKQSHMIKI